MGPDLEVAELLGLLVALLSHLMGLVQGALAAHVAFLEQMAQEPDHSAVMRKRRRREWFTLATAPQRHRFWVYPQRNKDWWQNCVMSSWVDEEWLRNFRMTRRTFMSIVESLRPLLQRQETNMRASFPVEMVVGMAIWYLASPNSFREVKQRFGVGLTSVAEAVHDFCRAVKVALFERVVWFEDPVEQVMEGFAQLGFPQCVGAIDGCHIPIRNPSDAPVDYINRRNSPSIVLMAVCDHKGRFFDVEIGPPGRSYDAHIFRDCHLTHAMDRGEFFPGNPTLTVEGVAVPALVLADGVFPMRRWLVKPYAPPHDARERYFNERLSRARCVAERAFGRLKARWRCLLTRLQVMPQNVKQIVGACVVLHNICESEGHEAPESTAGAGPLLSQLEEQQPISVGAQEGGEHDPCDDAHLAEGRAVREALATYLYRGEGH
ncbi:putative nuclease HARBI1 [Sphaerodactylus townsendi]|uniref:putative nuclease HARBI1 n=1 Tax=Sphaerodactylus townsendi TaxID=933632 RepID=UPI002025CFA8|nr:putative nuclease HARBI1 [Sphaerodactylus townsendi]